MKKMTGVALPECFSTDPALFFQTIADASFDWEYWLLPDGTFAYVSPACERICGYSAAELLAQPQLMLQMIDPRDKEKMKWHFQPEMNSQAIEGLELNEIDFQIISRDRQPRWLSLVFRTVCDSKGNFLGRRGSLRDITERKQRELELRALQMAARDVAVAIVITDPTGKMEYVNPRFCEMTGYAATEVLGQNPRMFRHPSVSADFYQELWQTITAGKSWKGRFRNVRKDGKDYWEAATISPVFDEQGEIIGFVAGKEDISEEVAWQERLEQSEVRFRKVVLKTPLPLCYMNVEGTVGFINEQFTATFGYTSEDLPSLAAWWQAAYPDENYRRKVKQQWEKAVLQAMAENSGVGPEEREITCRDGKILTVLVSAVLIEGNVLVGFVDITERKRQEHLLYAAYDRKKRNEILNELVKQRLPSRQALAESTKLLGQKALKPFHCIVVKPLLLHGTVWNECWKQPNECQKLLDAIVDELSGENRLFWESPEGIGVLCYDDDLCEDVSDDQGQRSQELLHAIAGIEPGLAVAVGISAQAANLEEIAEHFRQAVLAVEVGRKVWPEQQIYHYLELGSYQLWPALQDNAQTETYINRVLGKLLTSESIKRQEYFETLDLIIHTDNLKEIAMKLGIHYKTLLFRKNRLEQILGLSLEEFRNRQTVAMALQLYKLRGVKLP